MKFWKIKNELKTAVAEILLYGQLSDVSWWNDEVTPRSFAKDLEALAGKDVLVRINSVGGDVFAAHAIFNMLKTYSGHVSVIVDGLAASAATIVMMAGERVTVPDNALVMIHNPRASLYGDYSADEMNKMSDYLQTIKTTIVNAYLSRCKEKCSAEELAAMMDAETWLTGADCINKGFADGISSESISMALNNNLLIVNSLQTDVTKVPNVKALKKLLPQVVINKKTQQEEREEMSIENVEELRKAYPEYCNEIEQEIRTSTLANETARITALDALDLAGNVVVNAIVAKAKATGKTAEEIKDFVDIAKENTVRPDNANNFLSVQVAGNKASGVDGVVGGPIITDADERNQALNYLAKKL
ncbi:MAG: Clp protease ClpP [Acidaminococcaceae bacterium]